MCPGKVNAVAVCNDMCFAGIGTTIFVWQVSDWFFDNNSNICLITSQISTGSLLAMIEKSFLPITVLKISPSCDILAAGAEDGSVSFWSISQLASQPVSGSLDKPVEPIVSFTAHTLAVTDIMFHGLSSAVSVSLDGKCCVSIVFSSLTDRFFTTFFSIPFADL